MWGLSKSTSKELEWKAGENFVGMRWPGYEKLVLEVVTKQHTRDNCEGETMFSSVELFSIRKSRRRGIEDNKNNTCYN